MSGSGFHVHGPHDHELEHAAQHGNPVGDAQTNGGPYKYKSTIVGIGALAVAHI
jgi:hypothetical protein